MRAPVEARKPVARLIREARNIYHDSDTLMEYVKEITHFYSSETKTGEEILQQLYEDVRVMVLSYEQARLFSDYDKDHEKAQQFGVGYSTDKKFLDDMWGIAEALHYLFYITSRMKVFLSLDMLCDLNLKRVELRNQTQRLVFTKRQEEELKEHGYSSFIKTVHDATILYYEGEGYNRHQMHHGTQIQPPLPEDIDVLTWESLHNEKGELKNEKDKQALKSFHNARDFNNFIVQCYKPDGTLKDIDGVISAFNNYRINEDWVINKPNVKPLGEFLIRYKLVYCVLRTVQRHIEDLRNEIKTKKK